MMPAKQIIATVLSMTKRNEAIARGDSEIESKGDHERHGDSVTFEITRTSIVVLTFRIRRNIRKRFAHMTTDQIHFSNELRV